MIADCETCDRKQAPCFSCEESQRMICYRCHGDVDDPYCEIEDDRTETARLRDVAWAAQGLLNADTYVSNVPREQAVRDATIKLRQALGTWQMHHTAAEQGTALIPAVVGTGSKP